jgi:hypothetical protein
MTQHNYRYQGKEVLCGYDRPLKGYFLVVQDLATDDYIYSNLDEPTSEKAHPHTFDGFSSKLRELGIPMPYKMYQNLLDDFAANKGNGITEYTSADFSPIALSTLNNVLTENDRDMAKKFYYAGLDLIIYDEAGQRFENLIDNAKQHEAVKRGTLILRDGNEVSADQYSLIPRGALYEKFKSELIATPIFKEDGSFSQAEGMLEHLELYWGIDPQQPDADALENKKEWVIYHPGLNVGVSYDPQDNRFEVTYLNITYSCETLDLALYLHFDWALTECGYNETV